jgi:hypothetical protein
MVKDAVPDAAPGIIALWTDDAPTL